MPEPTRSIGDCTLLRLVPCFGDPPISIVAVTAEDLPIPAAVVQGEVCVLHPFFLRGDANSDGKQDISDAVKVLSCLFIDRERCPGCEDAADSNDDGSLDISDPIHILSWLFGEEARPGDPFPGCGPDPSADFLTCPLGSHDPCGDL